MFETNYASNYGKQSFSDLVQSFSDWQKLNGELSSPPVADSKNIEVIDIEPGLQLRIWDCTFTNGLGVLRQSKHKNTPQRTYTLLYFLTPDSSVLEDCERSEAVINEVWNTVLMSSDATFKVQLLPGKTLRCVSVNFSAGWLQKNVWSDISLHHKLLQSFTYDADPFILFESISKVERRISESLFADMDQKEFGKFFWRSRVLNLVTSFFSRLSEKQSAINNGTASHTEQIAEVQKQLLDNIYIGLPDIATMARQASVSQSILKRYFRKIYGKNIYSYYQEKRMICAKQLLVEENKTVTETARIMGYGSVSSFNNTFKRFFGLKPDKFQQTSKVAVDI